MKICNVEKFETFFIKCNQLEKIVLSVFFTLHNRCILSTVKKVVGKKSTKKDCNFKL